MESLEHVYFVLHLSSSNAKLSEFPHQWLLMRTQMPPAFLPTHLLWEQQTQYKAPGQLQTFLVESWEA